MRRDAWSDGFGGRLRRTKEITDDQKAAAYYKFGALHEAPPFVPATVRTTRTLYGDFPFRGAGVLAGDHECRSNKWGAVSVTDRNGNQLGLRLNEFEPLTWRENLPPNAGGNQTARQGRSG